MKGKKMANVFANEDAAGTTLYGADGPIEKAARVCRWAASVVGSGPPCDEDIKVALSCAGLQVTEENVELVRTEIDRLDKLARRSSG